MLVAALLLGFGLRVCLLDGQSLWGDEAVSVSRAQDSLADITAAAPHEGTLPPLYYYSLHFWEPLAGTSEFAVRFPSVLCGVLAAALLYIGVRRTSGEPAGLLAALLGAASPFWVYYGQETRMYAQALMLSLASTVVFLSLTDPRRRAPRSSWVAYVLVSVLALFTHYFTGFVILAQNLVYGGRLVARLVQGRAVSPAGKAPAAPAAGSALPPVWTDALRWATAQLSILLLMAPWIWYVRESLLVTAGAVDRAAISLRDILLHLLTAFTAGTSVDPAVGLIFSLGMLALALYAVVKRASGAFTWLTLLGVPVLATYFVSFTPHLGWARYFIAASPAWLGLVATGLAAFVSAGRKRQREWRPGALLWPALAGLVALGAILPPDAVSLRNYYLDPAYARYDWRGAIGRMEAESLPSDAVIFSGWPWRPAFDYFFQGTIPVFNLPLIDPSKWPETERQLQQLARDHTGVWLVKVYPPEYDPEGRLEGWLAANAYRLSSEWVENTTFGFYSLARSDASSRTSMGVAFGAVIRLDEVRLAKVPDKRGRLLQVTLVWEALAPPGRDYKVFAHAVDGQGRLVAQSDSPPVGGFRPTGSWLPGDVVEDRFAILLPATPADQGLALRVGLYGAEDGRRLAATDATGKPMGDLVTVSVP
jgi:mannosyltransferase